MITRLTDPIVHDGKVTTIAELAKQGIIEFSKVDNFHFKQSVRTGYFADIKGTKSGWEISKFAFESRTKGAIQIE